MVTNIGELQGATRKAEAATKPSLIIPELTE